MTPALFRALALVLHALRGASAVISFQAETAPPASRSELLQVRVSGESADEVFGADSFGHHDGSLAAVADALRGLRRRILISGRHRAFPGRAPLHGEFTVNRGTAPPSRFLFTVNRTDGFLLHRAAPNTTADKADKEGEGGMEEVLAFIIGFLVVALLAVGLFFCCKRRAENDEKKQQARLEYEERERKGEEIRKMVIDAQAREDAERVAKRAAQKAEQLKLEEEERLQREQEQAKLAAEEKLKRAKKITRKALERHAKKLEQERRAREAAAAKEAEDKCAKCGDPIGDKSYVTVDGNIYHEQCFTCVNCERPITGTQFVLTIDGPVCRECDELKAAKCFNCGLRIEGSIKKVDGNCYHPACCVCTRCGAQITDSYFATESGIICDACDEADYKASLPVCIRCKLPIESSCAVVEGKTMHKACFQCAKCFGMIKGSYYKLGEADGRYECEECHESTS